MLQFQRDNDVPFAEPNLTKEVDNTGQSSPKLSISKEHVQVPNGKYTHGPQVVQDDGKTATMRNFTGSKVDSSKQSHAQFRPTPFHV